MNHRTFIINGTTLPPYAEQYCKTLEDCESSDTVCTIDYGVGGDIQLFCVLLQLIDEHKFTVPLDRFNGSHTVPGWWPEIPKIESMLNLADKLICDTVIHLIMLTMRVR